MGAPARLIDLSVARPVADAARTHRIGTDAYMSPEQWDPDRYGVAVAGLRRVGPGRHPLRGGGGYRAVDLPADGAGRVAGSGAAEVARRSRSCLELRPGGPRPSAQHARWPRALERRCSTGSRRSDWVEPCGPRWRPTTRRCSAQAGQGRGLGPVGHRQLGEDVGHVVLGGLAADEERRGDLAVRRHQRASTSSSSPPRASPLQRWTRAGRASRRAAVRGRPRAAWARGQLLARPWCTVGHHLHDEARPQATLQAAAGDRAARNAGFVLEAGALEERGRLLGPAQGLDSSYRRCCSSLPAALDRLQRKASPPSLDARPAGRSPPSTAGQMNVGSLHRPGSRGDVAGDRRPLARPSCRRGRRAPWPAYAC